MRRHRASTLQKVVVLLLIGIAGCNSVSAQKLVPAPSGSVPLKDGISWKVVVHKVPPEYPYEARRRGITGHGILFGLIDFKTGIVTSVTMEKSTGSPLLDQAALNAFSQWRFKPGTVRRFRTPITYEMSSSRAEAEAKIRRLEADSAHSRQ
jgi:TonB family protein